LRSGWPEPSSDFRLTCREKPIPVSSLRTLIGPDRVGKMGAVTDGATKFASSNDLRFPQPP
jgi:hypothetical protein